MAEKKTGIKKLSSWLNDVKIIIIAVIFIISGIISSVVFVDSRYAKAEEYKQHTVRFDVHELQQDVDRLLERLWKILDRIEDRGETPERKEILRERQQQYDEKKSELDEFKKAQALSSKREVIK